MRQMQGLDGELIQRLMAIVDDSPPGEPYWWLDVSGIIARAIGGCGDVAPESDRFHADGTISWEHQGARQIVPRVFWLNRLRSRLATLVGEGMEEDFLVNSLRDQIDRELRRDGVQVADTSHRTTYENWIAEQAAGSENVELSLIARAIMSTPSEASEPVAPGPDRVTRWASSVREISPEATLEWKRKHALQARSSENRFLEASS